MNLSGKNTYSTIKLQYLLAQDKFLCILYIVHKRIFYKLIQINYNIKILIYYYFNFKLQILSKIFFGCIGY